MVWAGIIDNDVIGPFFFEANVDGNSYLQMLQDKVVPSLIAKGYNVKDVIFQHDGAPSHNKTNVRQYLNATFDTWIGRGGRINWPARSPDLNPLDFFVWGVIKDRLYISPPTNIEDLRDKVEQAFLSISPIELENTRQNFHKRLHWVVHEQGGLIEPSIKKANI